jgi:hypothetical protein
MSSTKLRRAITGLVAAPIALIILTACGGSNGTTVSATAGPADAGQTETTAAAPSTSTGSTGSTTPAKATSSGGGGSSSGSSGSKGCAPGGPAVPAGAKPVGTADLDGDGKLDSIWLADPGTTRTLGVKTARGARFTTTFTSAAPQTATAVAGRMSSGAAVILLDTGRSVSLYAVVNCKIVPSINVKGTQYTFDKGFTGYGSGVGCPVVGSTRHLAGYLATASSDGSTFKVTRTVIDLSEGGAKAANGTTTTLGKALPASSSIVKIAQSVSCGASGQALEPAG